MQAAFADDCIGINEFQDEDEYEQAAQQTLDLYSAALPNAELDLDALNSKRTYTCPDDECGKVFPD